MLQLYISLIIIASVIALDDGALCSLVASTNINSIYPEWDCGTNSIATSNYCTWTGISCDVSNYVTQISFDPNVISALSGYLEVFI